MGRLLCLADLYVRGVAVWQAISCHHGFSECMASESVPLHSPLCKLLDTFHQKYQLTWCKLPNEPSEQQSLQFDGNKPKKGSPTRTRNKRNEAMKTRSRRSSPTKTGEGTSFPKEARRALS